MSAETSRATPAPAQPALSGLRVHLANIWQLVIKELRSIRADPVMLILLVYSFSIAVYTVATGASTEAKNLSVGIVDEDRSDLSRQIRNALNPPLFKSAVLIGAREIDEEMDHGRLVFVLEIPPSFQADLLSGRRASVQLNVDATAMTQAGNGAVYIQSIIAQEVTNFLAGRETVTSAPVNVVIRAKFNPNLDSAWFTSVMQVISPTPHFVAFAQAVLYRGAGFSVVWLQLVALIVIGGVYFTYALSRFRRVIFGD